PFFVLAQLADGNVPRARRIRRIAFGVAVAAVTAVALYAPLWAGPATLERVREVDDNYLSSISALVILVEPATQAWLIYPRLVVLAAVLAWQGYRIMRGQVGLVLALYDVELALVLVAT